MCHLSIFADRVFVSWITAVHHLGAAVGGVIAWAATYWKLDKHFHAVPKYTSIMLTMLLLYFIHVLRQNSMLLHIAWHGVYYIIYSFQEIAIFNTLVSSINKKETGSYLTLSSVVAKLGNIIGPATLIMVSTLHHTSFANFDAPFNLRNAEMAYMLVLALFVVRVSYTFEIQKASAKHFKGPLEDLVSPVATVEEGKLAMVNSVTDGDTADSHLYMSNERHRILPYIMFAMNILSLIGAGLSIRFMFHYMVIRCQIEYRLVWLAHICIPIASAGTLFVIDKQAHRRGHLITIFITKLLALVCFYFFIKARDKRMILTIYVIRATLQNTPLALKTAVMLKHSNEGSNGYWIASDHVSRVIIFVSTILGGYLCSYAGLEYCFLATDEMAMTPNSDADFGHLTAEQRSRVMDQLNELQYRDTLETYNGMVDKCFNECISTFRSKELDKREINCVESCVKVFFEFSQRIGQRFAEKQQQKS
ncbi:mitochondrial import inner membrane translocase [Babesia ovis]|uniref:Mitochondrial import inner membrane translocase n=1 Tax=Babesia ovis TaxID=5869 RepID=A0A9W5TE21_BABOV|nr:mitochondrial import inner membrane translocase [Babesia ovis]